jgi:hypothetical protein
MKTNLLNRKSITRLLFALLLAFIFIAPVLKAQSLVGWWKMDEGSGTTLIDSSGQGNNGTTVGSPTWTTGVINQAISLNGTTQYTTVIDTPSLRITSAITLSAWIKPTSLAGPYYILKKAKQSATNGYELSISGTGTAFFRFNQFTSANTYRVDTKSALTTSTWVHIAATFNGTTLTIYRNGIADSSKTVSAVSIVSNNLSLGIGAEPDGVAKFPGAIDDARVYNGALTAAQILALAVVPPSLTSPTNLSTGVSIPTTFSWTPFGTPTSYRLEVSTNSGFSSTVYDSTGITTTSISVPGLAENTTYYWRVNATKSSVTSGWSAVWSFTTIDLGNIIDNGAGYMINYNGSDNRVLIADSDSLDLTTSATLEAWVYRTTGRTQRIIAKENNSGTNGYELSLSSGSIPFFRLNQTTSADLYRVNATTVIPTNTWTHIAGTFDGTNMFIYVNGILEGTKAGPASIVANTLQLTIGAEPDASDFYLGQIDEVRIWRVARSQSQVQDYMCKKLSGTESRLVGYWRFDEDSGTIVNDETANNNDGTLNGTTSGSTHDWSGAALGDASAYDYDATGGYSAKIFHTNGDSLTATTTSGTISGIQVYRVDDISMRTSSTVDSSGWTVDPLRYWGVKVIGTGSPTYKAVYNYTNHPGITTDANLRLVSRTNISDASWSKVITDSINTTTKNIYISNQTGTEYALASTSDALPVELSSFSASVIKNSVRLKWRTETEVSNYGFEVQRSEKNNNWEVLGFVPGNGNSNSPKNYSFTDDEVTPGKYSYRLKQIDTDGQFAYSKTIAVDFGSTVKFELSQNYPNPFNPVTTIQFSIPQSSNVKLTVFNILGEQVAELVNGFRDAGVHTINFDASQFNSGLYIYKIESNGLVQTRKMLLVK